MSGLCFWSKPRCNHSDNTRQTRCAVSFSVKIDVNQWKVKCNCNIRKYNALSIIHSRGIVMYQKQYLRLLYIGLTTQQIYKLINQFPIFFTINNSKQTSALRGFLTTTKINNYHKPLQKFISLDDSDIAQHLYQSQVSTISIDHTAYPKF